MMAQKDFEKVTEASNYLYEEMLNRGLREGRVIGPAQIEAEITNPVEYDARGYVPSASIINFYAEMGVCEGKLGKDWLQDILREIDLQESDGELRELVWLKDQGRLADEELGRIMISLERKHNLIHNLPQNRLYDFTGTAHNLTEISNWLLATRRPQTSLESEEVCGLLVGERGLGKSTIIKEAGWACAGEPRNEAEKFAWPGFSYIFYFNANEESLTLEKLLQQMAFMFGQPGKVTDNPNLQLTVAETLQKPGNESLLIIDNYAGVQDKELKKFLSQVKSGFGLTILLTARPEDLAALSENEMTFRKIELSSLREDKACELFLRLIEKQLKVRPDTPENASINPIENNEVLLSLIKKLGSNPYLIKVYASFMAAQRTSPREVLDRLNATKAHQFSLIFGDITGQIWDKCGYDARQLWAILYFFSKPVTTGMLREVSGFHTRRFNRAVAELETYRVLEAEGEGAFRACELVKAFGKAQIKDFDEMSFRKRWVTYYRVRVVWVRKPTTGYFCSNFSPFQFQ